MRQALRHIATIIAAIALTLMPLLAYSQSDVEEYSSLQQSLDSILATITPDTPDSTKAVQYYSIAHQTEYPDSAIKYAKLSLKHCQPTDTALIAKNYGSLLWGYATKCYHDSAYIAGRKAVNLLQEARDSALLPLALLQMSVTFEYINNDDSAMSYIHNALDICIRTKDTTWMTYCYYRLGCISYGKRYMKSAEGYFRQSLQLNTETGNGEGMAIDLQWLGNVYALYGDSRNHNIKHLYLARDYFKKAIAIHDTIRQHTYSCIFHKYDTYGDIADTYIKIAKTTGDQQYADSCLTYYKAAEDYFTQHGYTHAIIDQSRSYVQYLMFKRQYKDAINFLTSIEQYFDDNTDKGLIREHHLMLKEAYMEIGDWHKAFQHLEQESKYNSLLVNDSTMSAVANSKTQQALIIERINQENAERIHAEQQSRMTAINIALLIGLVLTIALAISIHRALKHKKRSNNELLVKNQLLNSQKSEIEAQRDEIEHQRDIISQQWKEVETANQQFLYSINYARQIQAAVIPSKKDLDAVFSDNFVYYHPKNIVSGDFYSAVRCGRYSVMITADCTGHGIPGALLSMLGISALKEYMATESDAGQPGAVLDRIRDFVKATLNTDDDAITSDGMDMTICCIDHQSMTMKYAIANQTAIIIHGGETIRLKGDSMPLGRFLIKDRSFNTYTHPIAHGDMLYMFSDGIQDQIGYDEFGEQQRFTSQRLIATIHAIHALPLPEQLATFTQTIATWQGALPQIDDMTLVGIRI